MRISQKMTAGWLALSMILFAVRSEGQTTVSALPTYFDVKSMMPTSPDAAILGRFGEVPIGHYTGTANISVPIYTIEDKEANFSLPIVLSYHSSGVKVEDQGGVAGLGWSLSAEGSIIQIVNGKEDTLDDIVAEDPTGYATLKDGMILGAYSKRSSVGTTVWPCGSGPGDGDDPVSMGLAMQGDGQPDLYAYNFAGYSGKFYVNPETHQPTLLDEKVPLTFVRTGFHTWKAITLDGNVFNFGALEYSNTDATGANFSGYTAKLTSVQLNDGKTVTFNYAPGYYEWYNYSENFHIPYIFGLTPATEVGVIPSLHTSLNNIQYLTSIQANNVTVNFNLAGRSDLFGLDPTYNTYFPERVNSIDIIDPVLNRKLKTFQLYASYFPYSSNGGSYQAVSSSTTYIGLRLRLDSVQEMGYSASGNAISEPPYRFYYDQT